MMTIIVTGGIPIRMSIAAGAQWETYAPTPGPISLATTIYEEYDEYSGCMSADYDTKQTFAKLRELASSGEYFRRLVADAQDIFDKVRDVVHPDDFNVAAPDALSEEEREEFIELYLSEKGLEWALEDEGQGVIEYAATICTGAEIPHYDEYLPYMQKGHDQRIFGFSETGAEFSKDDRTIIKRGCSDMWCWVNSCVYDIQAPTYTVEGVPVREAVIFGKGVRPDEFVEIEKKHR